MSKKKLAIYPFSKECIPLAQNISTLSNSYILGNVISPVGLGLVGRDIGFADNRCELGIAVSCDAEQIFENNDGVIILKEENKVMREKTIKLVKKALLSNKEVHCMFDLSEYIENHNVDDFDYNRNNFIEYTNKIDDSLLYSDSHKLFEPSVPVVFVGGLIKDANQTDITLMLKAKFNENNINAIIFSDNTIHQFFDSYNYSSIFSSSKTESEKVNYFNNYIRNIVNIENPDVIIVQLPDVLMKFNNVFTGDFGISTYLITQAIMPDYFICCSMYGMYDQNSYKFASDECKKKFGFKVNAVHISNKMIDSRSAFESYSLEFYNINMSKVEDEVQRINDGEIPIFSLLDSKQFDCM